MDQLLGEINATTIRGREIGGTALAPSLLAGYQRRYDDFIAAAWAANPGQP